MTKQEALDLLLWFAGDETMSNEDSLSDIIDIWFQDHRKAINKKNNKEYIIIDENIVDATNLSFQTMVLYTDGEKYYVREKEEFNKKFIQ